MLKLRGTLRLGVFAMAGVLWLTGVSAHAEDPPKDAPPAEAKPAPEAPAAEAKPASESPAPDDGTVAVNLNNVDIDNVVKFLSEITGKLVIKHKDAKAQLSISSAGKVTKERAFQLVTEALMLEKVAVVEDKDSIKLVPADALSEMTVDVTPSEGGGATAGIVKAVISVQFADVAELEKTIKPLLSKSGTLIAHAPSKKLVITDTAARVQAVKDIVAQVDVLDTEERQVKVFELKEASPDELAPILKSVLTVLAEKDKEKNGKQGQPQPGQPPQPQGQPGQPGGPGGDKTLDVVPYKSANWLVVVAPKEIVEAAVSLVAELDREKPKELSLYVLPMRYADVNQVAEGVTELYRKRPEKGVKDTVQITADARSNSLLVLCSEDNFASISQLVKQLDTEESVQTTTRTFQLTYADADDVAEQMTNLYQGSKNNNMPWYWSRSETKQSETRFVSERRTNSVVAIAKPTEMTKIEELIKKLDTPIDADQVTPRIYRLKFVEAKEVTDVMNDVFGTGESSKRGGYYDYWFDSFRKDDKEEVGRLYGKVRFVTEPSTNSIIVTTNNNENFKIIEAFIAELDQVSPDAANTLVLPLQHAKAKELAGQLNALFSAEGARIPPQQQRKQAQGNGEEDEEEDTEVYYSWMFGSSTNKKSDDKRAISNLIGQVRIVPDIRTNSLTVTTAAQNFQLIRDLVQQLDIPTPKVHVQVRLIEVTTSKGKRIGARVSSDASIFESDDFDNGLRSTLGLDWKQLYHNGTITGSANFDLSLLIQYLQKSADARILAEPMLVINNNQPGDVFVGAEIPFITDSQSTPEGTLNQSFKYKPAGTTLKITPNVNELDRVEMKVELESSQIRPGEVLFGGFIIDTRKFNTEVAIESGDTIVIGGIMRQSESRAEHNVPVLGKVPVLNLAFGKRDREQETTELIAFITPTVMRDRTTDAATTAAAARAALNIKEWLPALEKATADALAAAEAEEAAKKAEQVEEPAAEVQDTSSSAEAVETTKDEAGCDEDAAATPQDGEPGAAAAEEPLPETNATEEKTEVEPAPKEEPKKSQRGYTWRKGGKKTRD